MNTEPKSSCCGAALHVFQGGEGTAHYVCCSCQNQTDAVTDRQDSCDNSGPGQFHAPTVKVPIDTVAKRLLKEHGKTMEALAKDEETTDHIVEADKMVEELAAYAHRAWSGWMNWMFEHSTSHEGEITIPKFLVDRWTRQMNTLYDDLPEEEKQSDRAEAEKIINTLRHI
jgi:hypothetical protein